MWLILLPTGDLDKDAFAPRLFVDAGLEVMVAQSYSKNLGLYGERVGALNVILNDAEVSFDGFITHFTSWSILVCAYQAKSIPQPWRVAIMIRWEWCHSYRPAVALWFHHMNNVSAVGQMYDITV